LDGFGLGWLELGRLREKDRNINVEITSIVTSEKNGIIIKHMLEDLSTY